VPCAYTRDSWNESLTQYVDSVLYGQNRDGSLQAGMRTIDLAVPLSVMSIPHDFGSATYYRGAYVMRMLENLIGLDKTLEALQVLVRSRVGKDTAWSDLRQYFEATSGKDLGWFWDQWIDGSSFPKVNIVGARTVQREGKYRTFVTLEQSGTPKFFRLKFKVVLKRFSDSFEKVIDLEGNRVTIPIDTDVRPDTASLDVFGYALVYAGKDVPVTP
jgi:aminopeptidase N